MAVHLRWQLIDPSSGEVHVFEMNPNAMTSPFASRNLTAQATTASKPIVFEGSVVPHEWSFEGLIQHASEYATFLKWFSEKRHQVVISDHFGRRITCLLKQFDPTPKRRIGKYWAHTYRCTVLVTAEVGAPTVGEVAP